MEVWVSPSSFSSVAIISTHVIWVKSPSAFPQPCRRDGTGPPCSLIPSVWLAIQLLPFSLLFSGPLICSTFVPSSYVFLVVWPLLTNFYTFVLESKSSGKLLCKWPPKMSFCSHSGLCQTFLSICFCRKMCPLLSFAGGFHKSQDEMFFIDLSNKEKILI
jgi:hypothetical protein